MIFRIGIVVRISYFVSCISYLVGKRFTRYDSRDTSLFYALCLFCYLCFGIYNFSFAAEQSSIEADQQINDFSVAGQGEKGKKEWDLRAKTADIFQSQVKLDSVVGNFYGKGEDIRLSAKKGDFNKENGKVNLKQDVVITTSGGTKLTTDSLDWDRKGGVVTTGDPVNIKRDNMTVTATGVKGQSDLKQIALERDVRLDIEPVQKEGLLGVKSQEKIIITCDGPLEVDYEKNIAQFSNNVKVSQQGSEISSDKMDVYFIRTGREHKDNVGTAVGTAHCAVPTGELKQGPKSIGSQIDKIIAKGNVKISRGENVSYSEEALYTASDKKIVLTGRPKLIINSTEDAKNAFIGN